MPSDPFELVFCDSKGKELVKYGPIGAQAEAERIAKTEAPPGTKSWIVYRVRREVIASGEVSRTSQEALRGKLGVQGVRLPGG